MVVNCVEKLVFTLVGVFETWVKPLLLQKELYFIFLQHNKVTIITVNYQLQRQYLAMFKNTVKNNI